MNSTAAGLAGARKPYWLDRQVEITLATRRVSGSPEGQNGRLQSVLDVLAFQGRKKIALNGSKRGKRVYTLMRGNQNGNPG